MFCSCLGALYSVLSLVLLGVSGIVIFIHKVEKRKYTTLRGGFLAVNVVLAGVALMGVVFCIRGL